MQGFIVFDYLSRHGEARKELAQWLSEGKIKRKETIIKGGLKVADKALTDLYKGVNTGMLLSGFQSGALNVVILNSLLGKLLVEVKPDDDEKAAKL
jgi:hypothetical protein